jgi:hypothetical protein
MTETYGDLGGQPTPKPQATRIHGCPPNCHQPHTHAHTHPGGHHCTWEHGNCGHDERKED